MFLNILKQKVQGKGVRIVFTEGWDPRIQIAVTRLIQDDVCEPILLGNKAEIEKIAQDNRIQLGNPTIIDPETYEDMEPMVKRMYELRKGKMSEEKVRELLKQTNYFGTMLVEMGLADGLLGGATYSTADTVRPALQLVKCAPGQKIVSSCFLLVKENVAGPDTQIIMSDCGININPNAEELASITEQAAESMRKFGGNPIVALLSYSTNGSAEGDDVTKMREVKRILTERGVDFPFDGEMQFDCAVNNEVAAKKFPNSPVGGNANTFIFPNLSAGNIGYKITARLGGFEAMGPILQGLNAPINDLSRGCNPDEVYNMAVVTAVQKFFE